MLAVHVDDIVDMGITAGTAKADCEKLFNFLKNSFPVYNPE